MRNRTGRAAAILPFRAPGAQRGLTRWARDGILGLLAGLLIGSVPSVAATAEGPEPAVKLVDAAIQDTLQLLGTAQLTRAEATQRLRTLLDRYVDMPRVGRDSLGSYWRHASPEQQAGFLALFESFLADGYSGSVVKMGSLHFGQPSVVEHVGDVTVVRTDVELSGGGAVPVLFMVGRCDDGSYRVVDVVAAAISMSKLFNADFGAVLRNNGGRVDALIDALEHKVSAAPVAD
jgi:phospholipid transport system substrate-binding protein